MASVSSMGGQGGLGWLAASRSLAVGYVAGGIATVLTIPWLLGMRRLDGHADQIVGKAGRYTACETLALPATVHAGAERDVA